MHIPTKTLIAGATVCAAFASNVRGADMTNEPTNFRGLAWSSAFPRDASLKLVRRDGEVAYYTKPGEKLSLGQADAIKIAYRFYKDKFSAGVVQTYGADNKKTLIGALHDKHGASTKPYKRIEQYRWEGRDVHIVLTCEVTSYCAAEFVSVATGKIEAADTGSTELPTSIKRDDDDGDDD